ncbi:MAG: coenzyme F420-0:L-glutamate ligase [Actinomycetes bacterium]
MITIRGIAGLPQINAGDDLATLVAAHTSIVDGDVVVITSKIVSKAEDRLVPALDRVDAIAAEAQRVVAQRGRTSIVETRHGFIMAAAGVDMSDVPHGFAALLPLDPDASARKIRGDIQKALGITIGVIITDTFGRAWRDGLVDMAIGAAGIQVLNDFRGRVDGAGNLLEATVMATVDEIASASELVRQKLTQSPVAIISGINHFVTSEDGPGVSALIRKSKDDWFRLGHREAITTRRTIREFTDEPIPLEVFEIAVGAALTAPAPHHTHPLRFIRLKAQRVEVLDHMTAAWRNDLEKSGTDAESIEKRLHRGRILYDAPEVILAFVSLDGAHTYGDQRDDSERDMFMIAGGAGVANFLLALHGEGVGSAWISSTIFCSQIVRETLGLKEEWQPLGAIAVGYSAHSPHPRSALSLEEFFSTR